MPEPTPEFGLYLLARPPGPMPWPSRWVTWPDFRLPADPLDAVAAFHDAWRRSAVERVEVGCRGGLGRTGTALACIAVLDGVPAQDAVAFVRDRYAAGAVETRAQRRFVERISDLTDDGEATQGQ